ncbi:MAG: Fpg/Nei family DNA glycosylase [Anaerolineae bacterium]
MPELPDLEVAKEILTRRIVGRTITNARVLRPTVLRVLEPGRTVTDYLQGAAFNTVSRRAKMLLLGLGERGWCAVHLMYWGRLRLCPAVEEPMKRDYLSLELDDGLALRYNDQRGMGKIYLTSDLGLIPGWAALGPEPLGSDFDADTFCRGLHGSNRAIKMVLKEGDLVAGIGNAYADEILWEAKIYPFRKASELSNEECRAVQAAIRSVLGEAVTVLREHMDDEIELEWRENLKIHRRGGQPCPRCGHTISQDEIDKHITSYCQNCQPGSYIRRETPRSL